MNLRDASFNEIANGQYDSFIKDANIVLNTVYHLSISIYTDGSGNNFALDTSGNIIQNRSIINITYSYPYINSDTQQYVVGFLTLIFDDGSSFSNTDEYESSYWFLLDGMDPPIIKQFT